MITIIEICPSEDGYTVLFFNSELINKGDEYHDDIGAWIDGWIEGWKYGFGKPDPIIDCVYLDWPGDDYEWADTQFEPITFETPKEYIDRLLSIGFYEDKNYV